MEWLIKISDHIDRLITQVGRIAAWAALLLVGVIMLDVVTRRFFVLGSTKLQELEWHIHTVLFVFCLGFGYVRNAHVRIELVSERLSRRTQCWIELAGCLLFLIPYCMVVLYFGADWWWRSWSIGEVSDSATGLPYRWLIKAALPLGFAFVFLSGVSMVLRMVVELFGTPKLAAQLAQVERAKRLHLDDV